MVKSVPKALFEGEAYRLFYQEFQLRLEELSRCLSNDATLPERSELSRRFHTLKGGSGFFGFDEVYRIAGELERLFADQPVTSSEDSILRQAHQQLETQRSGMPFPAGRTHA